MIQVYNPFQNQKTFTLKEKTAGGVAAFQENMERHVKALKIIRSDFGIYLHDFPAQSKLGCSQHCTLLSPAFHKGMVNGISPCVWLWQAINGEITDVGMELQRM